MKKFLFAFFVMFVVSGFGQTILSSHVLNLKKPKDKQQSIIAVNNQNQQVFAFTSDKENQIGFKYNSALFYKDSIAGKTPESEFSMSGYSFNEFENPEIYWTTENFKKIKAITYDFDSKSITERNYELPFEDETITNSFSENGTFYVIAVDKKTQKLKCYLFRNNQLVTKTVDFSSYVFSDGSDKNIRFSEIMMDYPMEFIDSKSANILLSGIQKNKLYIDDKKITITCDIDPSVTRLFEISLSDFTLSENTFQQPTLNKKGRSNSYFHENVIYQISLNDKELALSAQNIASTEAPKIYKVSEKGSISFKNSPLFSQTGNQRTISLKNTKKFLRRLGDAQIGLTVYKTPNDILLTVGGIRQVSTTGDVLLGITAGVGMVLTGTGGSLDGLLGYETQAVFFESLFDEKFNHKKLEQQQLATDYISRFLGEHDEISLQNVVPYKDFYIMGYYDSKAKQYILRKFADDKFME